MLSSGFTANFSKLTSFLCYTFKPLFKRVRVGYKMVAANEAGSAELATIMSYPTNASGTIVFCCY